MTNYTYRLETLKDYAAVEALTREAFWNIYKPGCDEHYIIHSLRGNPDVLWQLNYLCEDHGRICGHIFYTKSKIVKADGREKPVITFGPVSVHPKDQKLGIGSALIRLTLEKARQMGFGGVVITGNPSYYHRFGFRDAVDYGIRFTDGASFPELMALELTEHGLDDAEGRIRFCPEFDVTDPEALMRFDAQFPPKVRLKLPGQL